MAGGGGGGGGGWGGGGGGGGGERDPASPIESPADTSDVSIFLVNLTKPLLISWPTDVYHALFVGGSIGILHVTRQKRGKYCSIPIIHVYTCIIIYMILCTMLSL